MANVQHNRIMADEKYWICAKKALEILLACKEIDGIPYSLIDNSRTKQRVAYQFACQGNGEYIAQINQFLAECSAWLTGAPNWFVPVGDLLYMPNEKNQGPAIWGMLELLAALLGMCRKYSPLDQLTRVLRERCEVKIHERAKVTVYREPFSQIPDNWSPFHIPEESYNELYQATDELFFELRKYVKRHYDHKLIWTDNAQHRTAYYARLINMLWLYDHQHSIQAPVDLSKVKMIDDTLFYAEMGRSIEKAQFDNIASSWPLSRSVKKALIVTLRSYQSFLYQNKSNPYLQGTIIDPSTIEGIVYRRVNSGKPLLQIKYCEKEERFFLSEIREDGVYYGKALCLSNTKGTLENTSLALNAISGGTPDALDDLARLLCYCCCNEKRFRGAVVLPAEYQRVYSSLINLVLNGGQGQIMSSWGELSAFSKKSVIDMLINAKLAGVSVFFCNDDGKRLGKEQRKQLSKVIRGVTITGSDPILGRKKHINTAQFIVFGTDKTVKRLEDIGVKCFTPRFAPISEDQIYVSQWMQVLLPLWGILVTERKNTPPLSNSVDAFLALRCQPADSKDYIEARSLYEKYHAFCAEYGYSEPVLFKDFNRRVEKEYTRKQLHKSTHKSPTVFYGVELKKGQERTIGDLTGALSDQLMNHLDWIIGELNTRCEGFSWSDLAGA